MAERIQQGDPEECFKNPVEVDGIFRNLSCQSFSEAARETTRQFYYCTVTNSVLHRRSMVLVPLSTWTKNLPNNRTTGIGYISKT
jgi:hypothetical protein